MKQEKQVVYFAKCWIIPLMVSWMRHFSLVPPHSNSHSHAHSHSLSSSFTLLWVLAYVSLFFWLSFPDQKAQPLKRDDLLCLILGKSNWVAHAKSPCYVRVFLYIVSPTKRSSPASFDVIISTQQVLIILRLSTTTIMHRAVKGCGWPDSRSGLG